MLILIGFGLFSICTESNAQTVDKVKNVINESNNNYMRWFNNGQADSLTTLYRGDACLIPYGCGEKNIYAYFQSVLNKGYVFKEMKILSVSVGDTIAVEKGNYVIMDNTEEIKGMYLTEWRFSNKKWLIVNDISYRE